MTTELLERRLETLALAVPDAGRVTARALSSRPRPQVRRWPRVALSGVATVLLFAGTLYFVPVADLAIAKVPAASELLQQAGLVGAGDRIRWVDAVSTSSGLQLRLVGAYADSTRTVLIMHAEPAIATLGMDPYLTDQFGRLYRPESGYSNALTGDVVVQFKGLEWPAGLTGARVTLHTDSLELPDTSVVTGEWTLTATVTVDEERDLRLPASATTGRIHYQFTHVAYTPATVVVDMLVSGVTAGDLDRRIPDGGKGTAVFSIALLDPDGKELTGSYGWGGEGDVVPVHLVGFRVGGGGNYTLRVSYIGEGSFERVLSIP